jgi:hypothetical protein
MTCIDGLQSKAKPFATVHIILGLNSRLCWTVEVFSSEKVPNALKVLWTLVEALVPQTAICQGWHSPNHQSDATGPRHTVGRGSLVDEMWQEERPPHHLKLLPKTSCGGSYDTSLSCANSALSFICQTNFKRQVLVGSYSLWPMRLHNCFLRAYKSVDSFWDVVPYSRRPLI